MLSWILGVLIIVVTGAFAYSLKLLWDMVRQSEQQDQSALSLQDELQLTKQHLTASEQLGKKLAAELKETHEALLETKSHFGIVKKGLKTTIDALKGRNFRSKREPIEHNKHFQRLVKTLDSL